MKLRAGVIGLGVGAAHAEALHLHPNAELTALCDANPQKLAQLRQQYPDAKAFEHAEELISSPGLDLIVIASNDEDHFEQVSAGIAHGKHLFVEKPLCQNASQAGQIRGLLREHPELHLSSNLILRYYERSQLIKQHVASHSLGELYLLEGDYNYGRLEKITGSWRSLTPDYSVMAGGGLHIIDLFLWLTQSRVAEVSAFGCNIATEGTQFKYDDTVLSVLRFADGKVAKICANFGCVYPHAHKLSLYGTQGTLESFPDGLRLWNSRDEQAVPQLLGPELNSQPHSARTHKGAILTDFVTSIVNGTAAPVTIDEIFAGLAVCFAIEDSVRSGQTTKVVEF